MTLFVAAMFQSALRINGPSNAIEERRYIVDKGFQSALRINGPSNLDHGAGRAVV